MTVKPLDIGAIVSGSDPFGSLEKVTRLGLTNCQMSVPPQHLRTESGATAIREAFAAAGVTITAVFCGYPGESYADIPTIHRTVGLVPAGTRAERLAETLQYAQFCAWVQAPVLAAHIGFVPDDPAHPDYLTTRDSVRVVCRRCGELGLKFALETGQETAATLLQFINDVDRPELGVNFDPANMMLYGSGDPLEALDLIAPWVIGAHAKDGDYPTKAGELGEEYPLGQGKVDFGRFIAKLKAAGYAGALTIEREISGDQQIADIKNAIRMLEQLRS